MQRRHASILRLPLWLLLAATLPAAGQAAATAMVPADGVEAITKPSGDVKLAPVEPGIVAKMLVKEGTSVKAGEVLIQQDDSVLQVELAIAKAEAEDTIRIEAATAQRDQKQVDLEKIKEAFAKQAASRLEMQHAELDVTMAELQIKLEKFSQEQQSRKVDGLKLRIDRMKVRSPIDGKVEEIAVKEGEAVDAMMRVLSVVNVDPLWIDVPMPLAKAAALYTIRSGGGEATVDVYFAGQDERWDVDSKCSGRVIHIAQVANPASQRRIVRVEVPNPTGRPAGEHVLVSVPADDKTEKSK